MVMNNITLVGFMGTGKTTVAKLLSGELKMHYVSSDELIEEKEKMSINSIFRKKGEAYFRASEREVLREILDRKGQVVDAGGGAMLDERNVNLFRERSILICLTADAETVHERTSKHSHRPLLDVKDPLKKIKELMEKRRNFYAKAPYHIDTSCLNIEETLKAVKNVVEKDIKQTDK